MRSTIISSRRGLACWLATRHVYVRIQDGNATVILDSRTGADEVGIVSVDVDQVTTGYGLRYVNGRRKVYPVTR